MIDLVTGKEFGDLWTKVQELIERTKRHTKQIKELQKEVKQWKIYNQSPNRKKPSN